MKNLLKEGRENWYSQVAQAAAAAPQFLNYGWILDGIGSP